jgi:hypothetical protein
MARMHYWIGSLGGLMLLTLAIALLCGLLRGLAMLVGLDGACCPAGMRSGSFNGSVPQLLATVNMLAAVAAW